MAKTVLWLFVSSLMRDDARARKNYPNSLLDIRWCAGSWQWIILEEISRAEVIITAASVMTAKGNHFRMTNFGFRTVIGCNNVLVFLSFGWVHFPNECFHCLALNMIMEVPCFYLRCSRGFTTWMDRQPKERERDRRIEGERGIEGKKEREGKR